MTRQVRILPGPPKEVTAQDQDVSAYLDPEFCRLYEVYSFRNAASILSNAHSEQFKALIEALKAFRISTAEIVESGGNKTRIAKRFETILNPLGWVEARLSGDLHIRKEVKRTYDHLLKGGSRKGQVEQRKEIVVEPFILRGVVDGHKIDFVRDRIAFDLEWNSKDQTFDRDLYAMRTFHECGFISAGILLTRSSELVSLFREIARRVDIPNFTGKFGASTTWMGKLSYRLSAGRAGGCPILALGMRPALVEDFKAWKSANPVIREVDFTLEEDEPGSAGED